MNPLINRTLLLAGLFSYLLFGGRASASDLVAASNNILLGLQSLTNQTRVGLVAADGYFASAMSNAPTLDTAIVLKTATALAVLQGNNEFINLLSSIGVTQPNQSLYSYDYQLPTDTNGNVLVSGSSTNVIVYLDVTLLPQVTTAISSLSRVSSNVLIKLTAQQTSTVPTAIDYGDVQMSLCILYLAQSAIYAIDSYNLGAALSDINTAINRTATLQSILETYPSLFTFSTVNNRTLAVQAFKNASAAYQNSVAFISQRRVVQAGYMNLFSFNGAAGLTAAQSAGTAFAAMAASFSGPQTFPGVFGSPTAFDGTTFNLSTFSTTAATPRSYFSAGSFYGNFYNPSTTTDPTFGSVFPQFNNNLLNGIFLDQGLLNTYTPWPVSTIAGLNGVTGHLDGYRTNAQFIAPTGIAVDAIGNVFVSETYSWDPNNGNQITGNTIRKIGTNGSVTTIAGQVGLDYWSSYTYQNGYYPPLPFEGKATDIVLISPSSLAIGSDGKTLFIADGNFIRKLDQSNNISVYAGSTNLPWGHDDGFRTSATFGWINAIAFDAQGNLFIADSQNYNVRKISTNGYVTTIAGQAGVWGYSNGIGTNALFGYISGIAVDPAGNIFVADGGNNLLRKINPSGVVTTIAGQQGMDGWRDNYGTTNQLSNTLIGWPQGLVTDANGNLYFTDSNLLRRIGTNGVMSTLSGNYNRLGFVQDGSGQYGLFAGPWGIAIAPNGSLYVADNQARTIRLVTGTNQVPTPFPGGSPTPTPVPTPVPTPTSNSFGSALNFSGSSTNSIYSSIWGPGSNGIDLSAGTAGGGTNGGGINMSTKIGVGWAQQIGGLNVTSYSLQSAGGWVNGVWTWVSDPSTGSWMPTNGSTSYNYLATAGTTSTIRLTVPANVVLEVWNLNTLNVIASNVSSPGSSVTFTAYPSTMYGGYAWYTNNGQTNLPISANYIQANVATPTATPTPVPSSSPPNWVAPTGYQYFETVYAKVLDGSGNAITNSNSILAAFNGTTVVGVATPMAGPSNSVYYPLQVWSTQPSQAGLTYKIYNGATGQISTLAQTLNFQSSTSLGSISSPITLNISGIQSIPIVAGWNWLSFNVIPSDGSVGSLLSAYTPSDNDVIKGTEGSATYYGGTWYPSPSNFTIKAGRMYMLSSASAKTMTASGVPVQSPASVTLASGWNWVGCPLQSASALSTLWSKLQGFNNDVVVSQGGFATYSGGAWYPSTTGLQFSPGAGYQIYVVTPQAFSFSF